MPSRRPVLKTPLNVEAYQGPGGNWLDWSVRTDTELVVSSNGMPHYTYVDRTPNGLGPRTLIGPYRSTPAIPWIQRPFRLVTPDLADGIPIYGPNEAQMPDSKGSGRERCDGRS